MNKKEDLSMQIKRYSLVVIGILITAISFNLFALPNDLVIAGISGLSIVINSIFEINPAIFILICSIILLIISYIFLGKKATITSVLGSILFPLFVQLTANIGNYIKIDNNELLISAIFFGVMYGFGLGLVFKAGFTTGGTDIIKSIINKYAKVSMGKATIFTDTIIILSGVIVFGWTRLLYAVLVLYIMTSIIDKVTLGISDNKLFYIITSKIDEVQKFIINELETGVTILEGYGAYSGKDQKVLMCVVSTKDYFRLKEGIMNIDSNAFFTITDSYEVSSGH